MPTIPQLPQKRLDKLGEAVAGVLAINAKNKMQIREKILSALQSFRYLALTIFNNSNIVEKDLAALHPTKYMVYPCDVIDLRRILHHNVIEGDKYVSLFSIRFAEKYLSQYPLFVVVNTSGFKDEKCFSSGGIKIFETGGLDVKNAIYRLIINEPVPPEVKNNVNKIILDLGIQVEVIISNSVPGLSPDNIKLQEK